eukprot:5267025-Prymnesium_polylepis.1
MSAAHTLKALGKKSTYAKRGKGCDKIENGRAMSMAAAAMRQANQQKHSLSVCARSLGALAVRMPYK